MREWLKRRLLDGVWNSALTIAAVAFLVWAIPPVVEWVFLDAVWGAAAPDACRSAEGACWAMIHAKYRLIVFGRYPFVEQWRPLLGMRILFRSEERRLGKREGVKLYTRGVAE